MLKSRIRRPVGWWPREERGGLGAGEPGPAPVRRETGTLYGKVANPSCRKWSSVAMAVSILNLRMTTKLKQSVSV